MKKFNELTKKIIDLRETLRELKTNDYSDLIGTKVKITQKYRDWLREECAFNEEPEVEYELKRPIGEIIETRYDREDGITIKVKYPNGNTSYYDILNIAICNKTIFLEDCKK